MSRSAKRSRDIHTLGLEREEIFRSILTPYERVLNAVGTYIFGAGLGASIWLIMLAFATNDGMPLAAGLICLFFVGGAGTFSYLMGDEERLGYKYSYVHGTFSTKRRITSKNYKPMLNMVRSFYLQSE
jgi:hypothetical protein